MAVSYLDVLEVVVKMTQIGNEIRNVYQLIHAGTNDVTEADVLAQVKSWIELAYGHIRGDLANDLQFDSIQVNNITKGTPVGETAFTTFTAGGSADAASPLQIAAVVRFTTNFLGSQLRKFIPGLVYTLLNENGVVVGAFQTALAQYAAVIRAGTTVNGEAFWYGADNPSKARFASATGYVINDVVGTQRRRKQGVGV